MWLETSSRIFCNMLISNIGYLIVKLSKYFKISMQTFLDYRGFFKNKKRTGTSFQATFFVEFLDKHFSLVILHKVTKFHSQTMSTYQVIQ